MSNFWQRLRYYLFGFGIGLFFVFFFFQNRGCSWLPGNRVKNTILGKVLVLPESEKKIFQENGLSEDEIIQFLNNGDILFDESLKENIYPKVYVIEKEIKGKTHKISFSLYEDAYISTVHYLESIPQRFDQLEGMGKIIRIPSDSGLVFLDKTPFINCKSQPLVTRNDREIAKLIKETGQVNFDKSQLMLPKAEIHIQYLDSGSKKVEAKTIWFESRICFRDFYWDEEIICD